MDLSGIGVNYLLAAGVILLGIVIAFLARRLVRWLESVAKETETYWDDIIITAIGTPLQVIIIMLGFYFGITKFDILPESSRWLLDPRYETAFFILISAWIISTFLYSVIRIYGRAYAERSETDLDDRLVELLELVIRYVIWFAAVMAIFKVFNIDITPFLAGAGIAGIAVALAAQDLISNFFGGAIITVDKPFKVGDRVKVDNFYGDVVSVGTRSTRIKTLDYQIVTLPNNKITTNVIINYSEPDQKLRIVIPVTVAYGTDPLKVKKVLLEIAHDAIKKTGFFLEDPAPTVFFDEFGASSLNFLLKIWMRKYNLPDESKDAINCMIAERFAKEGIEIPFPQMDVHMKK
ncbi:MULTISPECIES: mechanosensitive ion channel family protein [unclassified Methanoregula]|uniref:mechanosensitive ion channel family protein n=1 Tax=unclassified Methanoregula TaxID=2649730 RepID=UPI0009C4A8D2|nr:MULTISPECIES: mechanosensitive ion channel family protein [unclassified Methanoregula]OPX62666.1 MAG: Small-conductance mechanosensitive channel MscMJ [Methanoregula sp. PtaB.Bin085]OPY37241.1 MAG: Small-conductance mechanosensitive channel MscMJ [Methanoregula sp. PtaU1.Bin006]